MSILLNIGIGDIKSRLEIDPELRDLIPPLSEEELQLLEESIKINGVQDPIEYILHEEKAIIIDGHNRYNIVKKLELPERLWNVVFRNITKEEAITYMLKKQLGRRNLTTENASYLRGKLYNQNVKQVGQKGENIGDKLADEFGVSRSTIKRDSKFAKEVDALPSEERVIVLTQRRTYEKKELSAFDKLKNELINRIKKLNDSNEHIDLMSNFMNSIDEL